MDYLNENVAINLRNIRKGKQMSLDALASETGLSKSMLGQIERGEANPTLATLGKITSGLRVSLMDLVGAPREEVYIIRKETLSPVKEEKGHYKNYAYFPYEEDRDFEIYSLELTPGGRYVCTSHGENTMEYIIVFSGELRIDIEGESYSLGPGDAIRLYSDKNHIYFNSGDAPTRFYMLFTWR
ncbi:transcriptional regulator, XRE family with cupin sensor [Sporobacter termitidis DSM 10068]|uniref:Transcriptional regulator, XRE family with cupin sensor n=1 Tax=Sporobacter termitidis DSM 10068 TaxID=1123282 RepID=A0A1M5XF21_9FIRM|nr:XRE family transcriptional regulator [Sporobacter termitidis]SHH98148.1 transcriptional regulator, XRE family with cupin sensor [Sporobacter termitidis DSM 10068]